MTLSSLLTTPIAQNLGWTLLHSLWQGAALALVLGLILYSLRSSPTLRYGVGCVGLAAMVALPLLTYSTLAPSANPTYTFVEKVATPDNEGAAPPQRQLRYESVATEGAAELTMPNTASPTISAPATALSRTLKGYLPWLAGLWLVGVVILSVRLIGGLVVSQRLKTRHTRPVSKRLEATLTRLARRLDLRVRPQVRESLVVTVPLVVGWLKPVILLPVSALSGLSPRGLELVLAHELAHISRHDYPVNLLQSVAETLLFYHPAVWWLSSVVRQEREHCCDDLAIRLCDSDRLGYARVLSQLDGLRPSSTLVTAASGGSLLKRIQRLAGRPLTHNSSGWFVALALLLVPASVLSVATAQAELPAQIEENIDTFVEGRLDAFGAPGIQVAVVQEGQVTFNKAYGFADLDAGTPMTVDTPMRLGGASVSLTAVAVMQLVERGLIDLDAPVTDYLPWLAFEAPFPVTPRLLMVGDVALPDPARPTGLLERFSTDVPDTKRDYLESLMVDGRLPRAQGASDYPSASNWILMGSLIEALTGERFEAYVQETIFDPLGLETATYSLAEARAAGLSTGYVYSDGGPGANLQARALALPEVYNPAYGVIMSSRDAAKLLITYLNEGTYEGTQILTPESFETMWQPAKGWLSRRVAGQRVIASVGALENSSAFIDLLPDEDFGVVSLANVNTGANANPHFQVAGSVSMALALLGDDEPFQSSYRQPSTRESDGDILEGYAGTFSSAAGDVELRVEGGRLTGTLLGSEVGLVPTSSLNGFLIDSPSEALDGLSLEFSSMDSGRFSILRLEGRQFAYRVE